MSTSADELRIVYWRQGNQSAPQNFGDFLSEIIASRVIEKPTEQATSYRVVGSCIAGWLIRDDIEAYGHQGVGQVSFWGCGVRDATPLSAGERQLCRIHGVRGHVSRSILGLPTDTVIGDTGFLLPILHKPTERSRDEATVCVPHYNDQRGQKEFLAISGASDVLSPGIEATEEAFYAFVSRVLSASFVLCGALHAAVVATAYGVPFAFWNNGHVDLPLKWQDFASSINIPTVFVRSIEEGKFVYEKFIQSRIRRPRLLPILQSAPFVLRDGIEQAARQYDERPHRHAMLAPTDPHGNGRMLDNLWRTQS